MRTFKTFSLIALLLLVPSLAWSAESIIPIERMTEKLPELVAPVMTAFAAVAWVVLTGALIFSMRDMEHGEDMGKRISSILALLICVSIIPMLANKTIEMADALYESTGLSTTDEIATKILDYASSISTYDSPAPTEANSSLWGQIGDYFKSVWNTAVNATKARDLFYGIKIGLKEIVIMVMLLIFYLMMMLCALIMEIFQCVRIFLVYCGCAILPVFVAGLGTQSYRSQSMNYILGLIGIICWPLGWALGHLGTVALFDWAAEYTGSLGGYLNMASNAQHPGESLGTANAAGTISVAALAVSANWIGILVSLFWPWIVVFVWVLLVTISAPFVVQRVVASGSQFFSPMAAGTAQMSAKIASDAIMAAAGAAAIAATGGAAAPAVAGGAAAGAGGGAAASGAAAGGGASAAGGGGGSMAGASVGGSAGGSGGGGLFSSGGAGQKAAMQFSRSLAKTLQGLSSWDGEPTSVARAMPGIYTESNEAENVAAIRRNIEKIAGQNRKR